VSHPYGFRIAGGIEGPRRLVALGRALSGHAACATEVRAEEEAYLSAFAFGADFRNYMDTHGTPRGFLGSCWSPWIWCDLDASDEDLVPVLRHARALVGLVQDRYSLGSTEVMAFFSGRKGFCIGLPTPANAEPSPIFNKIARVFAEGLAGQAGAKLDPATFVKVQPLRAPNSRHPRSGLHKIHLDPGELLALKLERIIELAREPRPFDWYEDPCAHPQALADWSVAAQGVQVPAVRRDLPSGESPQRLNRQTLEFIRAGANEGDRHRLLFSAAANLAELGCSFGLAWELLSPAALDSGLPPRDVERQIRCGLAHGSTPEGTP
jgi:hypothetical protein